MKNIIISCSSREVAERVVTNIRNSMEADFDFYLKNERGDNYSPDWKSDYEIAGPIWDLCDQLKMALESRFGVNQKDVSQVDSLDSDEDIDFYEEEFEKEDDTPDEEKFINRVKEIFTKAREKNGITIEAKPNGRLTPYTFNIDYKNVNFALDELLKNHKEYICAVLSDYKYSDGIMVVAPFIGMILDVEGVTGNGFQKSDMQFAFEPFYENSNSAIKRMSDSLKSETDAELLINTFKMLFDRYKK